MKLTLTGIENSVPWRAAGIQMPTYDVPAAQKKAVEAPKWVHFGIGNIFRVFIGGIADGLLEQGLLDRGITCVETFDYDVVDKIYRPYDNLGLQVILNPDGTRDVRVLGAFAEAVKAQCTDAAQWARLKEIFRAPSLQLVSFTITEKGYALKNPDGSWLGYVAADIAGGPDKAVGAMGVLTAMLHERFRAGGTPVALVSMDNCAGNGKLLRESVLTMARAWKSGGFVEQAFLDWLEREENVAFDSTMIDKITPRPSEEIARDLENMGVADMQPVVTGKRTYIAPFANAERPQYLVIEDRFPNGRPALEKGFGVYMGDFETVRKSERMKVTVCLNPAHTAVGPLGVVLGQERFADMLRDLPVTLKMARRVVFDEGMPVVPNPGILSPKAFADEVFERFQNLYLGDTNLRLATDASQGLSVRFGETIKSYVAKDGTASALVAIPLGIAGFFRYAMGLDDEGKPFELAPDPLVPEIHEALRQVKPGCPGSYHGELRPYLSNESIFGIDLYKAGLGEKIESYFAEMIAGPGAALRTIEKYINE